MVHTRHGNTARLNRKLLPPSPRSRTSGARTRPIDQLRGGLETEEKKNLEMRTAEVDIDLEKKYGLGREDDESEEEETKEKKRK